MSLLLLLLPRGPVSDLPFRPDPPARTARPLAIAHAALVSADARPSRAVAPNRPS